MNNGDPNFASNDQESKRAVGIRDIGAFESEFGAPTLATDEIKPRQNNQIQMYPNPSQISLTLDLKALHSVNGRAVSLLLYYEWTINKEFFGKFKW